MGPYDEFDPETGESRAQVWRRQHAERNFVTPGAAPAPLARREPTTIDQVPQWLTPAQTVDVTSVWEAQHAAQEKTSAVDRAKGLQLRLWPFLLMYAGAGLVVGLGVWLVAGSWPPGAMLGALLFAALGVGTYIKLNGQDYAHSSSGVERHRIDSATYLAERELDHKARMQEKALDAYLKRLERNE